MELDKFWSEEISRAIEAHKMGRVDPTDLERWKNYHANLKQTIESWKVQYGFIFLCCTTNRSKYPA
jgi:N-formylglutamate amidohydrolase